MTPVEPFPLPLDLWAALAKSVFVLHALRRLWFCLTTVECLMRGRIRVEEDAWLYRKCRTEVDVDSVLQATLPPGLLRMSWAPTRRWY